MLPPAPTPPRPLATMTVQRKRGREAAEELHPCTTQYVTRNAIFAVIPVSARHGEIHLLVFSFLGSVQIV